VECEYLRDILSPYGNTIYLRVNIFGPEGFLGDNVHLANRAPVALARDFCMFSLIRPALYKLGANLNRNSNSSVTATVTTHVTAVDATTNVEVSFWLILSRCVESSSSAYSS
jgi:hypothetical protein